MTDENPPKNTQSSHVRTSTDYFFDLLYDLENYRNLPYESGIAKNAPDVASARQLHAQVYQARGFVGEDDIDENGYLSAQKDPYTSRSRYFLVQRYPEADEEESSTKQSIIPVASGRHIEAANNSFSSFQFFEKTGLDPAGMDALENIEPQQCVEVSALVKKPGEKPISVLYLYREMLDHSHRAGYKLWLIVVNVDFYEKLQLLFGDTVQPVGSPTPLAHLNMTVMPAVLYPESALEMFHSSQRKEDEIDQRYADAIHNFFSYL